MGRDVVEEGVAEGVVGDGLGAFVQDLDSLLQEGVAAGVAGGLQDFVADGEDVEQDGVFVG